MRSHRSILWPVVVSRLDAAYAVGILSQFMQNPGQAHWEALKQVMRYLGSTKNLWLTFGGKTGGELLGYCDTDWASQPDQHSISRFSFHFGQGAVSWSSRKQNVIVLSSTEAEYIAQTHAAKESIWRCNFISKMEGKKAELLTLNCDN